MINMTEQEVDAKLEKIDYVTETHRLGALEVLQLIRDAFPLSEVMPPEFKGNHSLYLEPSTGKLALLLWYDGKAHTIIFD